MSPKRYREQELRNAQSVNPDTGEVTELGTLTGLVAQQPTRAKTKREVRFTMVQTRSRTYSGLSKLNLTGAEWRLFWTLADFVILDTGLARVQTRELAGILGYREDHCSRMLGRLHRRGILLREGTGKWRFNPQLLGFGSVDGWAKQMDDAPKIDWEGP